MHARMRGHAQEDGKARSPLLLLLLLLLLRLSLAVIELVTRLDAHYSVSCSLPTALPSCSCQSAASQSANR